MKVIHVFFIVLLALMIVSLWLTIAHQRIELESRRIPEERLIDLLEQSYFTQRRLASVAAQNEVLTTRTLAILDRLVPAPPPLFRPSHTPDEPLVLYEAVPVPGGEHQ